MAITFLAPVAAGNAVQIFLQPPAGTRRWRLLRKRTDTIAAADDPGANVVHDGDEKMVFDRRDLVNNTLYFYRTFYLIGPQWVATASRSVTPSAAYSDLAVDVLDVVRDRLDLGFATYVERGAIQHKQGHVPVLLATPMYEDAKFPLVTVHLLSDAPAERFVGELMGPDTSYEDDQEIGSSEGWLSRYQLMVIVWCGNGDLRTVMRKALKSIVQANLPVFESTQMSLVEASFADADDMNTYQAPMYQATCTISCIAPAAVEHRTPMIRETDTFTNQ
ncbi:hypothetical protein LXA47_19335 [Massilia sp. P8910]|uniref:hypothetical protein n=1 Tax=Massilia antarctica TaxID=2765360 RepID=UPI001E5B6AE6|nr:hypothetical protein [Massilia antarctica]MCE3605741.1 hypothetical protein [Massilia antarctica]